MLIAISGGDVSTAALVPAIAAAVYGAVRLFLVARDSVADDNEQCRAALALERATTTELRRANDLLTQRATRYWVQLVRAGITPND